MFFRGDPIKVIGNIDIEKIKDLFDKIDKTFKNIWVRRTFALMDKSYCLKAITPSQFDKLKKDDEDLLREMLVPWITPYISENEVLVYLDISSLPPGAKCKVHIDYSWFHLVSRRIHIPLVTNPNATFALLSESGPKNYNLKVGNVYEINNMCFHVVSNAGNTDRWHILADVIDKSVYNYLVSSNKLADWGLAPSINNCIDPLVIVQLEEALKTDPINI